jgi:hypothetical protein
MPINSRNAPEDDDDFDDDARELQRESSKTRNDMRKASSDSLAEMRKVLSDDRRRKGKAVPFASKEAPAPKRMQDLDTQAIYARFNGGRTDRKAPPMNNPHT